MRLLSFACSILSTELIFSTAQPADPTDDTMNLFTLDSGVVDGMPMEDSDLSKLSFYQVQDQSLTSSAELTASDSESCPAGKKRDGKICTPPINLEIPSLLNVIGIGDGSDETRSKANSDATPWDWNNVVDPCALKSPYITHLCCHGPLGTPYGLGWNFLDQCVIGKYSSSLSFEKTR